jgi:hypothetical protein
MFLYSLLIFFFLLCVKYFIERRNDLKPLKTSIMFKFIKRFPKSILFTLGLVVVGLIWVFTESLVLKIFVPVIWYGSIVLLFKAGGFNEE